MRLRHEWMTHCLLFSVCVCVYVQGEASTQISGLGLPWFKLFHPLPGSAWADGNLAELVEQDAQPNYLSGCPILYVCVSPLYRMWLCMVCLSGICVALRIGPLIRVKCSTYYGRGSRGSVQIWPSTSYTILLSYNSGQGCDSMDFLQSRALLGPFLGDFLSDFLSFQCKLSRSFKQIIHISFSRIPQGPFLGDFLSVCFLNDLFRATLCTTRVINE